VSAAANLGKSIAAAALEAVRGAAVADQLVNELRAGDADPDALYDAVRRAGDGDRLKALCRTLQKALERGAATA